MSINREADSVVGEFILYQAEQIKRLKDLETTLKNALDLISSLETCNQRFIDAERPDLVVGESARIAQYTSLNDFPENANNFTPGFAFILGTGQGKRAITKEQLQRMRTGSNTDDVFEMKHMGAYVHTSPAFNRMLVLFPEFSDSFIIKFSQSNAGNWETFRPELFVAYQLMSRLVDVNDKGVMKDGKVDEWYLCR